MIMETKNKKMCYAAPKMSVMEMETRNIICASGDGGTTVTPPEGGGTVTPTSLFDQEWSRQFNDSEN